MVVEVESNEFPIKLLYNVVCCCIKFCTVTLYSKCQFNQHKMCIRLSQIGFALLCPAALLSQTITRKLFTFFSLKESEVCAGQARVIRRQKFVCIDGRRIHCGCKVDGTYFTNVAFIKTNDNILPRSSTSAGMNDNMTISRP